MNLRRADDIRPYKTEMRSHAGALCAPLRRGAGAQGLISCAWGRLMAARRRKQKGKSGRAEGAVISPGGMPGLQGHVLSCYLGAPQAVILEVSLFGLPLGTLLFLKQPPLGAGFVASGLVCGALGLAWKHKRSLLSQKFALRRGIKREPASRRTGAQSRSSMKIRRMGCQTAV